MTLSQEDLRREIRGKIIEFAGRIATPPPAIADDQPILETGLVDSASMMELVLWLETEFDMEIDLDALDMANFRSISAMAEFVEQAA